MAVTIEDASIRHLDRLYEIETECFENEAFTKQQIAQLLTEYNTLSLVAKENGKIIGFVICSIDIGRDRLIGHILTIDVSLSSRRKGVGLKLLQRIEKLFRERNVKTCHLEVREDNIGALRLYEEMGYKRIGRLRNYYGKANGLYLMKDLAQLQ